MWLTVEDGVRIGGAGEGVAEAIALMGSTSKVEVLGLPIALLLRAKLISYLPIWVSMPKALLIPLRICLVNRLSYTGISR